MRETTSGVMLAGGLPMGAVLCGERLTPEIGIHGTTFGGNALAAAAALAARNRTADHLARGRELMEHEADKGSAPHEALEIDIAMNALLGGLVIYELHDFSLATILVGFKILLIAVFIFMASPTATHAITDAGLAAGVKPWLKEESEETWEED